MEHYTEVKAANKHSKHTAVLLCNSFFSVTVLLRCQLRAGDRKRTNQLAGCLARVVPGASIEKATPFPGRVNEGSLFFFFDCVFGCVEFSYAVLDLVCSDYFAK